MCERVRGEKDREGVWRKREVEGEREKGESGRERGEIEGVREREGE